MPQHEPVPAAVLAGGQARPEVQAVTGHANRALVPVNGTPLLEIVVGALRDSGSCSEIAVVGDLPPLHDTRSLPDHGDFVANLFAGIGAWPDARAVLIATADLPFLTGPVVSEFVDGALAAMEGDQAALVYPIVRTEACTSRFPGVRRTSLAIREGLFTGGNLMLAAPRLLLGQRNVVAGAYSARKSPLKLAMMLGPAVIARLLAARVLTPNALNLPFLEQQVGRILGARVRALVSDAPEIATDLDRPSDFEAVGLAIQGTAP